jgi:hypothetical protein
MFTGLPNNFDNFEARTVEGTKPIGLDRIDSLPRNAYSFC